MIMVKAGSPVDEVIDELVPLLEQGDILIDGGNSHFPDSTRRTRDSRRRESSSLAPASPAARKGRSRGRRSCPAAIPMPGPT